MKSVLILGVLLTVIGTARLQETNTPEFSAWVDCVTRGPYEGMATAQLGYQYDGEFPITAEDARYFGDTATGNTLVFTFTAAPGTHENFAQVNVGALKVVTLKIVLFGKLHVVTIWDNPDIPDCEWLPEPTEEPTEQVGV